MGKAHMLRAMRSWWLIVGVLVASVASDVVRMPLRRIISKREKMIREGRQKELREHRNQKLISGSQNGYDYWDTEYLGFINVGTPAQQFNVILDTGSSDFWVPDKSCGGLPGCNDYCNHLEAWDCLNFCSVACCPQSKNYTSGHNEQDPCDSKHRYNSSASSTYQTDGRNFVINYGTGSARGFLGIEKVCLDQSGVCYNKQVFGQANKIADFFANQPTDGIFGMAWPNLAAFNSTPLLFNVKSSLDKPLFTVWLDERGYVEDVAGGLFTYGAIDTTHCNSNISYVTLSSQTYWQYTMTGFTTGNYTSNARAQVISDTGTSFLGMPDDAFQGVVAALGAVYEWEVEGYTVPCSSVSSLPDMVLTIGGGKYNIPSKHYIVNMNGYCVLGAFGMYSSGFGPSWILGDPFLRAYCHIFDMQNGRIGLTLSRHSSS